MLVELNRNAVKKLVSLVDSEMAAQANWMQSALLSTDLDAVDRAKKIAQEREDCRRLYGALRGAYKDEMGYYPEEESK